MKISKMITTAILAASMSGVAQADAAAFGLSEASGTVLIAAPSSVDPSANGLWFFDPAAGMFSLTLPELPEGYVYEGWIVNTVNDGKLSTGLFTHEGMIDSDAAGPFAGKLALNFPPVPGSDFVSSPIDITDGIHKVVITVEPYPDADPAPNPVFALEASIPAGTAMGTQIDMVNPN